VITEVSEGLMKGELKLRKALSRAERLPARRGDRQLRRHARRLRMHFAPARERAELHHGGAQGEFLNTAQEGMLYGEARAVHLGRTTQVWDALVTHGDERRKLALFRCTQLVLYPK